MLYYFNIFNPFPICFDFILHPFPLTNSNPSPLFSTIFNPDPLFAFT